MPLVRNLLPPRRPFPADHAPDEDDPPDPKDPGGPPPQPPAPQPEDGTEDDE
jgi:hypothetical protein